MMDKFLANNLVVYFEKLVTYDFYRFRIKIIMHVQIVFNIFLFVNYT